DRFRAKCESNPGRTERIERLPPASSQAPYGASGQDLVRRQRAVFPAWPLRDPPPFRAARPAAATRVVRLVPAAATPASQESGPENPLPPEKPIEIDAERAAKCEACSCIIGEPWGAHQSEVG